MTAKRRTRAKETPDFTAFVSRSIAALARRVAAGDVDALGGLADLSGQLDDAIRDAVAGLRGRGYSWSEIGDRLGVSKQAAHQRYG